MLDKVFVVVVVFTLLFSFKSWTRLYKYKYINTIIIKLVVGEFVVMENLWIAVALNKVQNILIKYIYYSQLSNVGL